MPPRAPRQRARLRSPITAYRRAGQRVSGAEGRGPARDAVLATAVTGLLCLAGMWLSFAPLHDWIRYPLSYTSRGDALANLWVIKTVVETGWANGSPALGAPFGATFLDFPRSEVLFLLFYRAASMVTTDVALIHNVFYLAGFPLVAWSALAVLRGELRVAWPLAVAGGIVFCWLPYHFLRLEHLHLSNYAAVPVAAWLVIRVGSGRPPFFERGQLGPGTPAVWVALALVAATSIYYAFFAMVLVAGVGAVQSIIARSVRPAASALLIVLLIGAALAIALSPALRYRIAEGPNPGVAARSIAENDIYSLRPIHLLLPSDSHRFAPLAALARTYNASAPFTNENRLAALGLIGSSGFVFLLVYLLTGNRAVPADLALSTLARANLLAVLFGVTGGLGALLAVLATPQFRALNRISVFIAFFSIAAVITAIDRALNRLGRSRAWMTRGVGIALVLVAVVDQGPAARPDAAAFATTFDSDRAFVERIERLLPRGAMVYQVPYTQFPEVPPFLREPLYSPMRMYVHSRALRWSYGGMKGRPGDYWHQALHRLGLPERVRGLRVAGFTGLVLDRAALPEDGRTYDAALAELGAVDRIDSRDGTLTFYRVPAAPADPSAPLLSAAGRGFHPEEGDRPHQWNWSEGNAELFIYHAGAEHLRAELTCVLQSLAPRQVLIAAPGQPGARVDLAGADITAPVRLRFSLHPGWNTVRFDTDRPAMRPTGGRDPRLLAFLVRELQVRPTSREPRASLEGQAASGSDRQEQRSR
jgi:phosphoglycerol transferase